MKHSIKLMTILFLWFPLIASAQHAPEQMLNTFFQKYEAESPRSALQYAFGTNPYFSANSDGVANVINQLEGTLQVVGDYTGYEKIKDQPLGGKLRYISYFIYYDRQPLRFKFEFYKPKDQWVFHNVMFDDKPEEELHDTLNPSQVGR